MATFDIQDGLLVKAKGMDRKIIVPDGVTVIGFRAFYENSSVEQIVLPNGVTKICSYAFERCKMLAKIFVPTTVTEIEKNAVIYCGWQNDPEIEIKEENPAYYSENGCLIERATKKLIMWRMNCPIP